MAIAGTPLRNRFHQDFYGWMRQDQQFRVEGNGREFEVEMSEISNHIIGAKALAFYLPDGIDFSFAIAALLDSHEQVLSHFSTLKVVGEGRADRGQVLDSDLFRFGGVAYFYCEGRVSDLDIRSLSAYAKQNRIQIIVRDLEYQEHDDLWKHPEAFISHDSADKERIARPISDELLKARCPVWFDEYSLNAGDNIREAIERGIKECKRCVIIISKSYIENLRWAKKEFESIIAREIVKGEKVILPIWVDVTPDDIYEFSPSLAMVKGLIWNNDPHNTAWELKRVIDLAKNG